MKTNHVWVCALTGFFAGSLAFFIATHNFEFFWPFNWPMKITEKVTSVAEVSSVATPVPTSTPIPSWTMRPLVPRYIVRGVRVKVLHSGKEQIGTVFQVDPEQLYPIKVWFGKELPAKDRGDVMSDDADLYTSDEIISVYIKQ